MNDLNHPVVAYGKTYQLLPAYEQSLPKGGRNDETINIAGFLGALVEHKWLILGVTVLMTLLALSYTLLVKPKYEANILIQVDESVAQPKNILSDVSSVLEKKASVATEMEVLRSRNILARVVDNTHLYINVRPKHFPIVGSLMANLDNNLSALGLPGIGGILGRNPISEQIQVSIFNVPEQLEGKPFIITPEDDGHYRLRQPEQGLNFKVPVNETVRLPSRHGDIELRVDQMTAAPGSHFIVTRSSRLDAIESLQKSLKITEKGRQSSIISVSLSGTDPNRISAVVNGVGREYIRETVDHRADEAEKSLVFLNKQLPILKQELENAEARYNQIRNTYSTVDLGEESRAIVQQSTALQTRMTELKQRRQELRSRFEDQHPVVETVNGQISQIAREINNVNAKIKRMPLIEQEVLRATRDVKVNTELYTNLLSTAQQLRQVSASRLGGSRLLDFAAVPSRPVSPNRTVIIPFAALFGLALGTVIAVAKKKMRGEVPSPYTLEASFGLPVSATIPHSRHQKNIYAQLKGKIKKTSVLPYVAPGDSAVEGLRGFRTVLQSAMGEAKNNIILITGPAPEVGKSFVCANIANVLASIDQKILLIDGDMRTGYLHRYFGLDRENGLSELISRQITTEEAIHKEVVKNVDFISTGTLPVMPAELLAHRNFGILLKSLSAHYDFVLIDTAPVLAFSDAMIVAPHAGAIYNVVRDRVSTLEEIEETVRRLMKAGGRVNGTIFNDMKGRSAYRYSYGY